MKYLLKILLSTTIIFNGCTTLVIKLNHKMDKNNVKMFGNTSQRNFFVQQDVSDSLKLLWEAGTYGGFANTSVTVSDSSVFVGDLTGRVYAINLNNGKELGQVKEKGAVFGSPVIYNTWLVYALAENNDNETTFFFYDFRDGKVFRQDLLQGRVLTEIVETEDGFVLVTDIGNVYKYNRSGLQEWNIQLNVFIHSSPAYYSGAIVFGDDNGEIIGINNENGKILYRNKIGGLFLAGCSISGESVLIGNDNGKLYSFDLHTGNIQWEFDSGFRIAMTPAFDDNKVFFGNLYGDLFCLYKSNGKLIWDYHSQGVFNVTPLVTNKFIIAPDLNNSIRFIDKNSGRLLNVLQIDGRPKLTPVLYKNKLIIGFDRGTIQAYEFIY